MIEKKTIVSQTMIDEYGNMLIQLSLLVVEDGVEIAREYHRTSIPPDTAPALQMGAVNDHLSAMGKSPVSAGELSFISGLHSFAKTNIPVRVKYRKPGEAV